MLKLITNKDGTEIHLVEIEAGTIKVTLASNGATVDLAEMEAIFNGMTAICENADQYTPGETISQLTKLNPDYVWAVVAYQPAEKPAVLTRRQFRLALVLNDFDLSAIEGLINQIADPLQRKTTLVEWQDATTFERNSNSLINMASVMGLTAAEVDALWLQAKQL